MSKLAHLSFLLLATTKRLVAFLERCHCDDDDCFKKSAQALRAVLADHAKAKRHASLVAVLMLQAAFDASVDGREVHWHVAVAARQLSFAWVQVSTLGTEDLSCAIEYVEHALEHLNQMDGSSALEEECQAV
jgi:hypothetical protein